jgi:hypothetical protein
VHHLTLPFHKRGGQKQDISRGKGGGGADKGNPVRRSDFQASVGTYSVQQIHSNNMNRNNIISTMEQLTMNTKH